MTDLNAGQPALLTTVSLTDFIAEFGEGLLDSLKGSTRGRVMDVFSRLEQCSGLRARRASCH